MPRFLNLIQVVQFCGLILLPNTVMSQREHVSSEKMRFALQDASYTNTRDGAITPNITTGFRPFDYTWSGPDGFVSKDSILTQLTAGDYIVHIEDALCGKFADTFRINSIEARPKPTTVDLVNVGPNPFGNTLKLTLKSELEQEVDIHIYSSFGISYLHQHMTLQPGQNKIVLDVSALPEGAYVLNVITEDNVKLAKTLIRS